MKSHGSIAPSRSWKRAAVLVAAGAAASIAAWQLTGSPAAVRHDAQHPVVEASSKARLQSPMPLPPRPESPPTELDVAPVSRLTEQATYNPFAALTLSQPQGPAPVPAPATTVRAATTIKAAEAIDPPPPVAPALPFAAVGSIAGQQVTGEHPIAFVKQQEQLLVLHVGDSIGQTYRVESITAQRIEFTYLPLMQRQALALTH